MQGRNWGVTIAVFCLEGHFFNIFLRLHLRYTSCDGWTFSNFAQSDQNLSYVTGEFFFSGHVPATSHCFISIKNIQKQTQFSYILLNSLIFSQKLNFHHIILIPSGTLYQTVNFPIKSDKNHHQDAVRTPPRFCEFLTL